MQHVNADEVGIIAERFNGLLRARVEWLCTDARTRVVASLQQEEWEISVAHGRLLFSFLDERGARVIWRVTGWEIAAPETKTEKISLAVERRAGGERATLELVPRARANDDTATVALARRAVCERLAKTGSGTLHAIVERTALSRGARRGEPGRYARILLRRGRRELFAVTGDTVGAESLDINALLASALVWFARLGDNKRAAGASLGLCLVAVPKIARALTELCALLRDEFRCLVSIYATNDDYSTLAPLQIPTREELFRHATGARTLRLPAAEMSEWAQHVIALAPDAIDSVRARHGETLRFHGLAFARIRTSMNRTRIWFGTDRASMHRTSLDEENWPELLKLIKDLREHRRAGGNPSHALFRAAPEAWLESLLRRDVTRLDPGLVISPIHAQFRVTRSSQLNRARSRPVDLLALRSDGRLVVIELKVTEDAGLPFQAAGYFLHVEADRLRGAIARAHLFGERRVADFPTLVYTVAPGLRFARSFEMLARTLAPEIEVYRFDLSEDWRAGVRVVRRLRANPDSSKAY